MGVNNVLAQQTGVLAVAKHARVVGKQDMHVVEQETPAVLYTVIQAQTRKRRQKRRSRR